MYSELSSITSDSRYGFSPQEDLGELLRRAAEKDWAAWDVLVRHLGPLVLRAAGAIGLKHNDAADAAQLTWIRLLEHIHDIREPRRLPGWLAVTARREGLRIALGTKRYVLSAEPDIYDRTHTDFYSVEGDYNPAIEAALVQLPASHEKLIRLLMCDSCPSYLEVARQLEIPVGSIGPMRMRALQALREALDAAIGSGTQSST